MVQGVLAQGVIDTGADITIMGCKLLHRVASVNKLKMCDFQTPDITLCTNNGEVIKVDGHIDLDIS